MVGQEPVLYARSIEENIRYGLNENEWSEKLIEEAAEMANAHNFIRELKDGYKTQTGEKGIQMSGNSTFLAFLFRRESQAIVITGNVVVIVIQKL